MSKGRAITLTNSSLASLLNNGQLVQAFPGMRGIAKQLSKATQGCRCGSNKAARIDKATTNIKQLIARWPKGKKDKLKKVLKADVIRMYVGKEMIEF